MGVIDHDVPEAFRQELDVTSPNSGDSIERTMSMKLMNNDVISGILGKGLSRGCKGIELMEQRVSPDHQKKLRMENFSPLVNTSIQEVKTNITLQDLEANAFAVVNAGKVAKVSRGGEELLERKIEGLWLVNLRDKSILLEPRGFGSYLIKVRRRGKKN